MRRVILTGLLAAAIATPSQTQDLDFTAVPKITIGLTNRGAVAGLNTAGLDTTTPGGLNAFTAADVAAGDFNADGMTDVAAIHSDPLGSALTVRMGEGDGSFGLPVSMPLPGRPTAFGVGDIDLDGRSDLVVGGSSGPGSGQLDVYSGTFLSTGEHNIFSSQPVDGTPVSITVNRLDGDAFMDIAYATSDGNGGGSVEVLFTNPDLAGGGFSFLDGGGLTFPQTPTGIDADVLNIGSAGSVDAMPDIAVATAGGVQVISSNVFDGQLREFDPANGVSLPLIEGTSPIGVVVADINRDNLVDVLTLNAGSGNVSVNLANSGAGYGPARTIPTGANPLSLATLDFNSDGRLDIAVANGPGAGHSGSVSLLTGDGAGGFTNPRTLPTAAWPGVRAEEGRATLFGHFGRLYENVPLEMNIRAFGGEVLNFARIRTAMGSGGLTLPVVQTGVTASTNPSSAQVSRQGHDENARRPVDRLARLGRFLGGLLTLGTPHPLASANYSVFAVRQMRAQVEPVQVVITATGQSTGDFFKMEIIDRDGNAHRAVLPDGVVLEPIAAPPIAPPPDARISSQDVTGFCMDFEKEVPKPGTRYRVANAAAQAQAAPIRNVLAAAKQMAMRNLLHTDGTQGYINFVRQYAVWAKREGWDLKKFGESFVERTKKNVAAAGANWTSVMEEGVRAAIPGRWRDIEEVLRLSNQIAADPARTK